MIANFNESITFETSKNNNIFIVQLTKYINKFCYKYKSIFINTDD